VTVTPLPLSSPAPQPKPVKPAQMTLATELNPHETELNPHEAVPGLLAVPERITSGAFPRAAQNSPARSRQGQDRR